MKGKSIITALLLIFVGGSVVYLVVGESPRDGAAPTEVAGQAQAEAPKGGAPAMAETVAIATPLDATSNATPNVADTLSDQPGDRTIAYYFHSTQRCRTCLAIERQAHEALTEKFAIELATGELEWHALNTDEPANEHFIQSYDLVASALVLVNVRAGGEQSWTNLDRVWDLVNDEPAFKRYVAEQTRAYLEQ